MKLRRRDLVAGAASLLAAPKVLAQRRVADLGEAARIAAIGLIPYYEMYATRWADTVDAANPQRMRLNRLIHETEVGASRSLMGPVPDADVLGSRAWLDVSIEPMFLSLPDMGRRFYSFALLDMSGRSFAQISSRLLGATPPAHVVVNRAWQGTVPRDIVAVRAPGDVVLLQGLIEAGAEGDPAAVRSLQRRTLLETPDMRNERRILETRELMRQRTTVPPEPVAEWISPDPANPFDLFEVGARVLAEMPPATGDDELLAAFHDIRLRPGRRYDWRAYDIDDREMLLEGIDRAWADVRESEERFSNAGNGWRWLRPTADSPQEERLYRAARAARIVADTEPEEAIVALCASDGAGRALRGEVGHVLRLGPAEAALAGVFWSIAALSLASDGTLKRPFPDSASKLRDRELPTGRSVEIRLQPDPPGGEAIWLRTAPGDLRLAWRIYQPSADLLAGRIRLPAVESL